MSNNTYHFPSLNEAEETGFNDPLILNFTDPIYNLTRESIQNIVDAKDPNAEGPVRAEFELFKIFPKSLPNSDRLRDIIGACWRHERDYGSEGEEFFKKAYDLVNDNKPIEVLKISDYNTTGLYGEEKDPNGAYYKLIKIQGSSNKTKGMGGSYGLGKGAYFRPSIFRTIFVSSVWDNNQVVFQGKLRFVSHEEANEMKHGIGFYSIPAIRDEQEIPKFFRRSEKGTSIFIIGFEESYKWQKQMAEAVLRYFWLAILEGKLEVKIGDLEINNANIETKIFEYFSVDKLLEKDNPISYYRAYTEGNVIKEKLDVIGNVELRILLNKDFPKRVEYFRNTGMVIQNKPFNSGKGFAAVFTCSDENEILRRMEDPTHSKWGKDVPTSSDPIEKKLYADAERELKKFVESKLKDVTASVETTESTIKDLDKYFYSPAEDNIHDDEGNPESIEGQIVQEETGSIVRGENILGIPPKINVKINIPVTVVGSTGGPGEIEVDPGPGPGPEPGPNPGHRDEDGDSPIKINKDIQFRRSFVTKDGSHTDHVVLMTGDAGDKLDIEVRVGTEDSFDTIDVIEATGDTGEKYDIDRNFNSKGQIIKTYIKNVELPDEGKLKLKIRFSVPGKFSLNLRAYENK